MEKSSNKNFTMSPATRGVLIGSVAIFISFLGASLTFPFLQSQRDKFSCDALCYGSMQSLRSGLSMVGTVLVGRLSDRFGRACALWMGTAASIISYAINLHGSSITAIWISIIPAALFNQNFSVLKALFADYSSEYGYSEAERASAVGRLGMAVGLSFMIGPVIGASCLSSYEQAASIAISFVCVSAGLLYFLPTPSLNTEVFAESQAKGIGAAFSFADLSRTQPLDAADAIGSTAVQSDDAQDQNNFLRWFVGNVEKFITNFLYLPALQTPGARLLMFVRCSMGLAFNIFMTVWTVSLKSRFDFGPKGHAYFMGWIGLWYALSQGFIARESIRLSGNNLTNLLLTCILTLSFGRVIAMATSSLEVVYGVMACVIIALGVMNTAIASACSRLAGRDQVGGLYGVMESVESIAGLIGPTFGGLLFKANPHFPLVGVVLIYSMVFTAVFLYYRRHVVDAFYDSEQEVVTVNKGETEEVADAVENDENMDALYFDNDDGRTTSCSDGSDDGNQVSEFKSTVANGDLSDDASSTDSVASRTRGRRRGSSVSINDSNVIHNAKPTESPITVTELSSLHAATALNKKQA